MTRYIALAADGDGTLTKRGLMSRRTLHALQHLLQAGRRLILVTGETLEKAKAFSHVGLFHRVVAENGAVLLDPASGKSRRLCRPRPARLLAALQAKVWFLDPGCVVITGKKSQQKAIDRALTEIGSDWQIVLNRRDLMILPPGVSKATGLAAALREMRLSAEQVVAVGDAENDLPMLECCGLGVAVANAVPLLKQSAAVVLRHKCGHGVAELSQRMVADDLPAPRIQRPCTTALGASARNFTAAPERRTRNAS